VAGLLRLACVRADSGLGLYLFRYYDRNWIGGRESILEGIVERLFLVPPRALGAIEVVVVRFAFWIGFHFKCSDPVPDAAINDPTGIPKPT
jgi:hypothetical protein